MGKASWAALVTVLFGTLEAGPNLFFRFAGSYAVESLTDELAEATSALIQAVRSAGEQ